MFAFGVAFSGPTATPLRSAPAFRDPLKKPTRQCRNLKGLSAVEVYSASTTVPGECIANKQAYDSPLPPFKRRKTEIVHLSDISPNLWTFEQPWTPVPFNNTSAGVRMVVYRLGDDADSLLVNNPVAPTGEVLEALKALNAPVKHIVISSNSVEHWVFAEKFASHFPDAKVWAPPGFFGGKRILGTLPAFSIGALTGTELGKETPPEWEGKIDYAVFQTPVVVEVALFLKNEKVLILSDTGFRIDETCQLPVVDTWIARLIGLWKRVGSPLWPLYLLYQGATKSFAKQVLGWDFEVLLAGHMACPVRQAKPQVKELFRSFL